MRQSLHPGTIVHRYCQSFAIQVLLFFLPSSFLLPSFPPPPLPLSFPSSSIASFISSSSPSLFLLPSSFPPFFLSSSPLCLPPFPFPFSFSFLLRRLLVFPLSALCASFLSCSFFLQCPCNFFFRFLFFSVSYSIGGLQPSNIHFGPSFLLLHPFSSFLLPSSPILLLPPPS